MSSTTTTDRSLDRKAIAIAAAVWAAEVLQWFLRMITNGTPPGLTEVMEKLVDNSIAFAVTAGVWVFLRSRKGLTAWGFVRYAVPLIIAASLLHTLLTRSFYFLVIAPKGAHFVMNWANALPAPISYLWIFLTWVCIVATMVGAAEIQARERALAASEKNVREARLRALRYQLQPHFLFNSLNTVAALIETAKYPDAHQTVERLARFLRHTLSSSSEQLVRLDSELDTQSLYLEIEAIRFADRLRVRMEVAPEVGDAMVPALILQPLVENAVFHGLARSIEGATIEIGARREGDRLRLWVQDDAVATGGQRSGGMGIGLENIRARLVDQYGPDAVLEAGPSGAGWRSEIVLPLEREARSKEPRLRPPVRPRVPGG